MSSPLSNLSIETAASWPCATAQMMFFGPKAASPPKNTLRLVDWKVLSSSLGRPQSLNSMPASRSIQGKAFSWPTATSTSSQGKCCSGSPAGTSLRRPLSSYCAFTFSKVMPVSLPFSWVKYFGHQIIVDRDALVHGVFLFPRRRLHFLEARAHHHLHVLAAEPARGAAAIHGGVAAAEHDHALADFRGVAERHRGQPVDADMDVLGRFLAAGDVEVAAARRAGADEDRVPAFRQQRLHAVDALAAAEFDAEVEDVAAFLVDDGVGQAEFRDLRADHAAGFRHRCRTPRNDSRAAPDRARR